jgi:polyphosphate kinase 2 PPK2
LAKPFRTSKGKDFRLKDVDPNDTLEFTKEADKPRAKEALATGVTALAELQDKLYAQDKWAVLLIFQAMDAAGKDGAIKHVMSGVNPQGCQVYSFKSPSSEDLDHDYLWRCMKSLPNRGPLESSIAVTTKRSSSFECIPNFWRGKSFRRNLSGRTSGMNDSKISAISNNTWDGTVSSFGNSFSMFQRRSKNGGSWIESTTPRRIGSSRPTTQPSEISGMITWLRMKK